MGGRFELVERAAVGGMGAVYRALDRATGEVVALKMLRDPGAEPERFAYEARVLAEIRHPHVVRYVSDGLSPEGGPYLVMEWLQGRSLESRLAGKPLGVEESVALAQRVAEALAAAHARGVVHRDLKPSNLLLVGGAVDQVKVIDFGIARWTDATTALTRSGVVLGTPGYMAPEQARGAREVGPQADVFSLGCVLFECLTGKPAFRGAHLMALLAKLLLEEPPPARELRPEVPEELSALVQRMLSKDPAERPADGAAVVEALAAFSALGAGGPRPAPASPPSALTALTATERRLVSVVAVGAPWSGPTLKIEGTSFGGGPRRETLEVVRRVCEPLGARVEPLANGTVLAVLMGAGSATDQAARAARCALWTRLALPDAPIALVTGQGEATGRLPLGETLERVAEVLAQADQQSRGASAIVAIDSVTRALLDTRFEVVEEPGRLWLARERLVGQEPRTLLGKASPFVGRDRELGHLVGLVEGSFEERRAVSILVTAPAGAGKSRLRQELLRALRERCPEVVLAIGRGDAIGAGSPFAMLGSAIRSGIGVEAGEPALAQRQKVALFVELFLPADEAREAREFLGELVGTPFPDEDSPKLRAARQDASIMADQIQAAYVAITRAVARRQPVLIVLEDLQWGDAPSVKLLDAALRDLGDEPIAVLAFARPEVHERFPRLWGDRARHEIRLPALPRRAAEQLSRAALGEEADAAQIAAIVERAGGNAFYLEEFIRALAEGGGEGLPATVLGMVEARLLALEPDARRLLRAGSIFGESFWKRGVLTLLGKEGSAWAGKDPFAELLERELLVRRDQRRFAGEEEYAFRHALIREASYAMLTDEDRALGHRLAGEWLERAGEPDPTVLAEHFARGGEGARAAVHHARAAERALQGNDFEAALAATARGLTAGADAGSAAALLAVRAEAAFWDGRYDLALEAAAEALRRAGHGTREYCRALWSACAAALVLPRPEAVADSMRRLLEVQPAPEVVQWLVRSFATAVVTSVFSGQRGAGAMYVRRMQEVCAPFAAREPEVAGWIGQIMAVWHDYVERDVWAAFQASAASQGDFERAGNRRDMLNVAVHAADVLVELGAFAEAERRLTWAAERAPGVTMPMVFAQVIRGELRLAEGALDEATACARQAIGATPAEGGGMFAARARLVVAEAQARCGDLASAEATLAAAREVTANLHVDDLWAQALLAELRLRQGRPAEARREAEEALARASAAGVFAHNHAALLLTRAEALHALGELEQARGAIREARDDLLARAARIEDPAYRQMFIEDVRANARTLALAHAWLGEDPPAPGS